MKIVNNQASANANVDFRWWIEDITKQIEKAKEENDLNKKIFEENKKILEENKKRLEEMKKEERRVFISEVCIVMCLCVLIATWWIK